MIGKQKFLDQSGCVFRTLLLHTRSLKPEGGLKTEGYIDAYKTVYLSPDQKPEVHSSQIV